MLLGKYLLTILHKSYQVLILFFIWFFFGFVICQWGKSQKVHSRRRLLHLPRVTIHYFTPKKWIVSFSDETCLEYCYYFTLYLYFTNYNSSVVLIPIFHGFFFNFSIYYTYVFTCVKKMLRLPNIWSEYFYRFIFNWKWFISKIIIEQ